ncbi:MAG TPA: hypothetical protein VFL91_32280 [Thermomicrobiales bacterium]|nr:hypothetical protein [Thermomicrobiales bacterium]
MRRPAVKSLALLTLLLLVPLLPPAGQSRADTPGPPAEPPLVRGPDADFFGVVGRDPYFEWNTDPVHFPDDLNHAALEGMAADIARAGAGWIRIELRAEHDKTSLGGPGYIDYRKWDWFIKECAPKYGLKVLLLLGSGLIDDSRTDPTVSFARMNDPADRPDGTNNYVRLYTERVKEVADHFGDSVAAYEILNEPNSNDVLSGDTGGKVVEVDHQRYGALLAGVYDAIKPAHPNVQLIVGGLIYGKRLGGSSADIDYLWELYHADRVQQYLAQHGRFPWDGVGLHTYFIDQPADIVQHVWAVRGVILASGDTPHIWMTEIGIQAEPPTLNPGYLVSAETSGEEKQAQFILDLFPRLLYETRGFVANVFWFKYEDFPMPNGWVNYGLVRLPISPQGAYTQPPWPRKPAYAAFQQVADPAMLPNAPESPTAQPPDAYYFPETQHAISGAFRAYWEQNGGLMRFGYPITSVFQVGGTLVQYFERARFEYHPENPPAYRVELGLLTGYLTRDRTFPRAAPIAPSPSPSPGASPSPTPRPSATPGLPPLAAAASPTTSPTASPTATPSATPTAPSPPQPPPYYFPQTGHNLGGAFLDYWQTHGGLASFGYPISEEFQEINQADGKVYTVQYFERARFEYHPENPPPYNVLLGLMGDEVVNGGGWYR